MPGVSLSEARNFARVAVVRIDLMVREELDVEMGAEARARRLAERLESEARDNQP